MYRNRVSCGAVLASVSILAGVTAGAQTPRPAVVDTLADTWVATDALGRTLASSAEVGPPRPGRFVGIFYFLWLGQHGTDGPYDVSKVLATHPGAMIQPTSPPWGPERHFHFWGEPLFGYYLSDDAWVLRKHAQLLSDAGVDTLVFDVTNQVTYPKSYLKLCEVFAQVRGDGGKTPQIAFLCPFSEPGKVVSELHRDFYQPRRYPDLWFHWKGKPLILADKEKVRRELHGFFTFRKPQPDYFAGPTGPNQWGWLEISPQHVFYDEAGRPEQMTVGVAQNGSGRRLCAFSEKDTYGRSWHGGRKDERPDAVNWGLNFAEQWGRALQVDPEFVFITGWNEWIAMRLPEFNGVREPVMFVDQYIQEYSRDIEPMKGGHGDNYYYQMVDFIRKFKGVRSLPVAGGAGTMAIDGQFDDWEDVRPEYRDDLGDVTARNHPGYDQAGRYVNSTGRNDLVLLKVAADEHNVYFYARTDKPITPFTDPAWMWLFVDADASPKTGWCGYDIVVNRKLKNATTTTLERNVGGWKWEQAAELNYHVRLNEIELAIPRLALGLRDGAVELRFDFKWFDNMQHVGDPLDFTVNGDAAPNGRFSYPFQQ